VSTVLVVDDSSTDMEVFSQCLRQAGLSMISAKSGEEAQAQLASNSPDLIILDVILPGQSGFELCRDLKNADGTRRIPVVMCSTKGTDVDKMWGDMLGADAYLTKPVNPTELIDTVRKLLTKS